MNFVSNIRIFRLVKQGGNIIKEFKRTDLNGFHTHHKITKDAGCVGTTPDRFGFRPSKVIFSDNYILQSYSRVTNKLSKGFNEEFIARMLQPREVWQGSIDTNTEHLSQFFLEDDAEVQPTVEEILEIANVDSPWFEVPPMDLTDPEEMYYATNYNPNSNPGHYTSIINCGSKLKKSTVKNAYLLALEVYENCRNKPLQNYSLWDVLAREKDSKILGSKIPSTRAVMNPEQHITMLLGWVFQKFMTISNSQGNFEKCRYMINKEMDSFKARRIIDDFVFKYDYVVDADWSYFDATISKNYLIAAVCIMMSNSIKSKKDIRFSHFIIESLVSKYVALPPGIVVKLNKGMPSGHPGVTAVNCIVNLLRWSILGFNIYGKNYWEFMDVIVYGDDAFVGFKRHPNLFKIDEFANKYGFKGDSISEKLYPTSIYFTDKHDTPDFLKRRVNMEGIYWNRSKIFDRMIYQTRKRDVSDQVQLILGYMDTAPFDDELNTDLKIIIDDILEHNKGKVSEDLVRYYKSRNLDFSRYSYFRSPNPLEGIIYEKDKCSTMGFKYLRENETEIDKNIISELTIKNSKVLYLFVESQQMLRDSIFKEGEQIFSKVIKKYFVLINGVRVPKFSVKRENFILNSS